MSLPSNPRPSQRFRAEYTYRDYNGELHSSSMEYERLTYPGALENYKPLASWEWHPPRERA